MNTKYVNKKENDGYSKLNKFNQSEGIWDELTGNLKYGTRHDVVGVRNSHTYLIELKDREQYSSVTSFPFPTVYIEPTKLAYLYQTTVDDNDIANCYFINFFGNDIAIWNIKKLDIDRLRLRKNIKIYDKGLGQTIVADRYLLPLTDATIYKYDKDSAGYYKQNG